MARGGAAKEKAIASFSRLYDDQTEREINDGWHAMPA